METRDDAGYVPFGGGLLLQSVDFFPPIVDDPYRFGQIAAANALSDVYAMGGEPLTAMNLVGFPDTLDLGILREILAGGQSKIEESGARLCGGHSIQDQEPKYGLSVTGFVEEDRVVRNAGAKAGDALVLTKPLGYGFLGHLSEMLEASGLGAVVRRGEVPVWERAVSLAAEGCYPGGLKNNREYLGDKVTADGVGPEGLLPLHDPQTSGGLLVAVPEERAQAFVEALKSQNTLAAVVGEVVEGQTVKVVP
jgi:selenide,water dikinase